MKNSIKLLILSYLSLLSFGSSAQSMVKKTVLLGGAMNIQVDSLKLAFQQQGFIVVKESALAMESQYEIPVIVSLKEGTWYRIVFIGEPTSKLYEVRMFDWNEKQVVYQKKMWGDVDGNIINYDYIPRFTEFHMIKPIQINKTRKQVTGYIMLFKKIISR